MRVWNHVEAKRSERGISFSISCLDFSVLYLLFPSKVAIIKFVFVDFMFIKNNIMRCWYQVAVWNSFDTSTAKQRCHTKMIMWYSIYPLQIYRSSWNIKSLYDILFDNIMSFYSTMPDCNTTTFIWTKNFLCHVQ